jgi:hypothetical protein
MAVKITRKRKNGSKRKTGKVMNGGSFRGARRSGRSRAFSGIPNPFGSIRSKSGSLRGFPSSPTIIVVNPGAAADPGPHLQRLTGALPGGISPRINSSSVQRLISKFSGIPETIRRAPINPGSNRVSKLVKIFTKPK